MNYLALVNESLSAIGKDQVLVAEMNDDIFSLGLTSIDKIMLLSKFEELTSKKVDIGKLGVNPNLTVLDLVNALEA